MVEREGLAKTRMHELALIVAKHSICEWFNPVPRRFSRMLDSLKLSVSVGVDVVPLAGVRRFYLFVLNEEPRFRDPRRAESNFRARRFTRPETLTVSDRCYTASTTAAKIYYPPLNLLVVPIRPCVVKNLPTKLFQQREKERGRGSARESSYIV